MNKYTYIGFESKTAVIIILLYSIAGVYADHVGFIYA